MKHQAQAKVAAVVVTRNRPVDIARCLKSLALQTVPVDVVVLDNASDPDKVPVVPSPATVLHTDIPLGVASARNLAFRAVVADVTVLLDDDAELADSSAIQRIQHVFASDPEAAALALNCQAANLPVGVEREQMRLSSSLRASKELLDGETVIPVADFIGAGCAFRTSAFRAVGGFREDFLYGYEELHLSLRLLDRGWRLWYLPDVQVLHHHSTDWRLDAHVRWASQLRNKWALAAQLLPLPWLPMALLPFTAATLVRMGRHRIHIGHPLREAIKAFGLAWAQREPLSAATVRKALELRGRL